MSAPAPVIAIDGPAGAGKGSTAALVARHLGWRLLDSGVVYRVVALAALRRRADLAQGDTVAAIARTLDISLQPGMVTVDGADETLAVREPEIDSAASKVSALPAVRAALFDMQRGFRKPPGLVADGRDMGTVVFPDARLKVFLTASAQERARRRYRQLKDVQPGVSLRALSKAIEERDRRDRSRAASPLAPAPDATTIDSTAMSIDAVAEAVLALARERGIGRL